MDGWLDGCARGPLAVGQAGWMLSCSHSSTKGHPEIGDMAVAWVYAVVSLMAVDQDQWMVDWLVDGRARRRVVF